MNRTEKTYYKCSNPDCGATDVDRGSTTPPPQFLNCWKCKAGLGMDPQKMFATRTGMFPCPQPPETVN